MNAASAPFRPCDRGPIAVPQRFIFCCVVALLPLWASAQTSTTAFDRFMALTTGANTQTIGFASGTPILTDTHSTGANLGNLNVTRDLESKGLLVAGSAKLPIGTSGRVVPVAVTGKVSAATLGKAFAALGSLAGGWPGVALMVGTPFLLDWLSQAGLKANSDGTFSKSDPKVCSSSPCYEWMPSAGVSSDRSSGDAACRTNWWAYVSYSGGESSGVCQTSGGPINMTRTSIAPKPASYSPATLPDVQAQLSTVQPDPWVLSELYNKAVLDNKIDLNIVAHGPSTVEGPAVTIVEPATATTPEKTTTTKTNYTCGYVLADVSCMEQKTKSSQQTGIDPATGQPYPKVELGTTTKEPVPKTITCGLPDTPVCAVKVDETGMPVAKTDYGQEPIAAANKSLDDTLSGIQSTTGKDTSWGVVPRWVIQSGGCSPTVLYTLPPSVGSKVISLDLCPLLPVIYTLMNLLWIVWTFGAVVSMVRVTTAGGS